MARYAKPGEAGVEISFDAPTSGLVGTLGVSIEDGQGNVVRTRSTAGIIESPAGSGIYTWRGPAPDDLGTYLVIADDGTGTPAGTTAETLVVTRSGLPVLGAAPAGLGPCSLWTTPEAVLEVCDGLGDVDVEYAVQVASGMLWELSGRRYSGRCRAVVRPQVRSRTCGPPWRGRGWPGGCRRLDDVKLAGYPIREIEEVLIDGAVLDPSEYALYGRHLIRTSEDEVWPSCQYLERPTDQPGTFQITYLYGADPPLVAQHAAAKLACQIARSLGGASCSLPPNVERVLRQGVQVATNQAKDAKGRGTGLGVPEVDAFLSAIPGPRRRAAVVSPDSRPYPLVVSTEPAPLEES